jgi:hypothetical protein
LKKRAWAVHVGAIGEPLQSKRREIIAVSSLAHSHQGRWKKGTSGRDGYVTWPSGAALGLTPDDLGDRD